MGFNVTTTTPSEIKVIVNQDLVDSVIEAGQSADNAEASANSASASAQTATNQAGIATTQAGIATTQAGVATTQANNALNSANSASASASTATAQAGIATTKANEASQSAIDADDAKDAAVTAQLEAENLLDLTNKALEYTPQSNVYEPIVKSSAIFRDTTSTFSGWGFPIGSPQNFDSIYFRIRTRATPVTKIAYTVYEGGFSTVLQEKTIDVNLEANTEFDILIRLDSAIANSTDANLYFFYRCNQFIDNYSIQGGSTVTFPVPPFEATRYTVSGALTGIGTAVTSPSTAQRNMWFITSLIGAKLKEFPESIILTKAKNEIKSLFNSTDDVAYTNSFIQSVVKTNTTEIFDETTAVWQVTTSTFSGWSTPIGTPQNFNAITFKTRARATAITSIRCVVRINSNGTILGEKTLTVNIQPNQEQEVTVVFDSAIPNSALDKLFFVYQCNQFSDNWGIVSTTLFPTSAGYDSTYYFVNGSQANSQGSISGARYINYVKISTAVQIVGFKNNLLQWLNENLSVDTSLQPTAELLLPSRIYATEGVEMNIFWDNVIFANVPMESLSINVTSTRGAQFERGWRYTPSTETGTSTIQIQVLFENQILADKTATIVIQNAAGGVGSKKIIAIGDSTTAGGQYISLITSSYGVNPSVEFLGTRGTSPNKHEGYSGYTFNSFLTSGGAFGNPFWIDNEVNFGQYLINNSFTLASTDLVTIHLGINDVFSNSSDANITTIISRANSLINAIRAGVANINIGLCITIPPSISQDAFGDDYTNGRTLKEYLVGYRKMVNAFLAEFDTTAKRTDKIWVIPFNVGLDRTYNFPQTLVNANARSTTQVTRYTDSVHPAVSGYNQMGDILWSFIKNLA